MPQRVVFALGLTPEATDYLRTHFPAEHELRISDPKNVPDEDLAWATAITCAVVPAERIAARANIRWLHVGSAGMDRYAGLEDSRPDLRMTSHGSFNAVAVAEHGLALLLALRRCIPQMIEGQRKRSWERDPIRKLQPVLIRETEAHVLGYGGIGRTLAELLKGVGMRVTVYRREAGGDDPNVERFRSLKDLKSHIGSAHAVFGVLPATPETDLLINRDVLAAMNPAAVEISLGRGNLIDEPALIEALRSGRIAGAALDVFADEPLPPESPLWTTPNLIVSPHIAGIFRGNSVKGVRIFLREFENYLRSAGQTIR